MIPWSPESLDLSVPGSLSPWLLLSVVRVIPGVGHAKNFNTVFHYVTSIWRLSAAARFFSFSLSSIRFISRLSKISHHRNIHNRTKASVQITNADQRKTSESIPLFPSITTGVGFVTAYRAPPIPKRTLSTVMKLKNAAPPAVVMAQQWIFRACRQLNNNGIISELSDTMEMLAKPSARIIR